jgi:hypothetical protein
MHSRVHCQGACFLNSVSQETLAGGTDAVLGFRESFLQSVWLLSVCTLRGSCSFLSTRENCSGRIEGRKGYTQQEHGMQQVGADRSQRVLQVDMLMTDRQKALEAAEAASKTDQTNRMAVNSNMQMPLMLTAGPGPHMTGTGPAMAAPPTGYSMHAAGMHPHAMAAPPTGYPMQAPPPGHRAW